MAEEIAFLVLSSHSQSKKKKKNGVNKFVRKKNGGRRKWMEQEIVETDKR